VITSNRSPGQTENEKTLSVRAKKRLHRGRAFGFILPCRQLNPPPPAAA
jgi:hypothetical protein